jgi:hypothetical protein
MDRYNEVWRRAEMATYDKVTAYLLQIRKMAGEYNKDPIPIWLLDALAPEFVRIATAHNIYMFDLVLGYGGKVETVAGDFKYGTLNDTHIKDAVNGDPGYATVPPSFMGIDLESMSSSDATAKLTKVVEAVHADVYNVEHFVKTANELRLDKTVLATWWALKHYTSDNQSDTIHDAWAFSRLYSFIPEYTTSGCVLVAYPITFSDHHNGINSPAQQHPITLVNDSKDGDVIPDDGALVAGKTYKWSSILTIKKDHNLKNNLMITLGDACMRIKDLANMVPYEDLTQSEKFKDDLIGESFGKFISAMEATVFPPANRQIMLKEMFKTTFGGASVKKTKKVKKTKPITSAVKAKLTAAKKTAAAKKTKPASAK